MAVLFGVAVGAAGVGGGGGVPGSTVGSCVGSGSGESSGKSSRGSLVLMSGVDEGRTVSAGGEGLGLGGRTTSLDPPGPQDTKSMTASAMMIITKAPKTI